MLNEKRENRASHPKKGFKTSWDDKLFEVVNGALLILLFLFFLYPVWFVVIASISNPDAVASGQVILLPKDIMLNGYKRVFASKEVWTGYLNTIFYTVAGTVLNVLATTMVAYSVSRRDLKGRKLILTLFIITMYFSGGMIPAYLNVRSLGLLDTRTFMLIGGLVTPTNIIICRTYFSNSVPWELQEAAFIDGASDFFVFRKIMMPLARPLLAVMTITYAVTHWNSYFNAMIYLSDDQKYPLQVFLRRILLKSNMLSMMVDDSDPNMLAAIVAEQATANQLKYALIVVAALPLLIAYPWVEKHFAKGIMIGGVKG
jgi:putative aldouronate transport system permease protein